MDGRRRLLANRPEEAVRRTGMSARQVALEAGLSGASITNMIRRLRIGEKETVTTATIEAIATAAKVSPGWLAFGEGSP